MSPSGGSGSDSVNDIGGGIPMGRTGSSGQQYTEGSHGIC